MTSRQVWPDSLCHGPQAAEDVKGKAETRVSTGPLLTPGSFSFPDPAEVWTYPEAPDLYV
jgi:hypothetical protein